MKDRPCWRNPGFEMKSASSTRILRQQVALAEWTCIHDTLHLSALSRLRTNSLMCSATSPIYTHTDGQSTEEPSCTLLVASCSPGRSGCSLFSLVVCLISSSSSSLYLASKTC